MNIGFIGLGTMGGSMALNAIRGGHNLVVHDIRRESATRTWRWAPNGRTPRTRSPSGLRSY